MNDTLKLTPRVRLDKSREIKTRGSWDSFFCAADGGDCLSDEEARKWWKEGFQVISFDFHGGSSTAPAAAGAGAGGSADGKSPAEGGAVGGGNGAGKPGAAGGGSGQAGSSDWPPKVEWHPSPLPPSREKKPAPEEPEPARPRVEPEPEPEPEARSIEYQPPPRLQSLDETIVGQETEGERTLKDAITSGIGKSNGPSVKLPGASTFNVAVGSGPIGTRMSARMDALLPPIYLGLGIGASDVDGRIAYFGDYSRRTVTDPGWGAMLSASFGFTILPPLCRLNSAIKNCSGVGAGSVVEALFHSTNVEDKSIKQDFFSYGPEVHVLIQVHEHIGVTGHASYRWLAERENSYDEFEDSGFFFDLGVGYLQADRGSGQ